MSVAVDTISGGSVVQISTHSAKIRVRAHTRQLKH